MLVASKVKDTRRVTGTQRPLQDRAQGSIESSLQVKGVEGGAGGQNVNKVATCVQLRYAPKNILVKMQEHRTQASNRLAAWKLLAEQLQRARDTEARERRMARELKRRQNAPRPRGVKKQFVELKRRRAKTRSARGRVGEDE